MVVHSESGDDRPIFERLRKMRIYLSLLLFGILFSNAVEAGETVIGSRTLRVPDGFEVELVADPSLVGRPIAVARDEKGRMYMTDSGGMTERAEKQLEAKPHSIRRLEDIDNDGVAMIAARSLPTS